MKLEEIEEAFSLFKTCPKCKSAKGFWFGVKRDTAYVQCKECGTNYELHEVYKIGEENKTSKRLRFFRK